MVGQHDGDMYRPYTYAYVTPPRSTGRMTVSVSGTSQRGRIGLIVPSSNTVVETDFFRQLPPDVTLHTARMFLADTTAEAERVMVSKYLPQAIDDIASIRPDVVAFACTSAGAVLGARGEAQLIEG